MDKFTILEQVGEGTFGAVYKARINHTNEIVAIKKMYMQNDEEGISYFALQEIKHLQQLTDCKNIIKLIDSFVHIDEASKGGRPCVVMVLPYYDLDLVGGLSALTGIKEIKCAFQQLLQGLQVMHSRNMIHRDIKPANLLMKNGEIVLADFGMTTNYKSVTGPLPHQVITRWYRPLELLFGCNKYGPEVDIWSAGITFVEMMTRKSPFPGHTDHHQADLILNIFGENYLEESPSIKELPLYNVMMPKRKLSKSNNLKREFSSWPEDALDLLTKMLCPAHKRLSASELLAHPFFTNQPQACKPEQMPQVESMHEFQLRQRQKRQHDTQVSSSHHASNKRQCKDDKARKLQKVVGVPEEKSNWQRHKLNVAAQ